MGKGAATQLFANSSAAQKQAGMQNANASNIYGGLEPTLQAEAAHPSGYTPTQKAQMNTAAQQSSGGSTAGAVGQGGLYAARTGNAGAAQNAIGSASRGAGENLSKAAVGTELNSTNAANQKQQQGIAGLGGLYSSNLNAAASNLNASNNALENEQNTKSIWSKLF
jgi:hypothetical protein